MGPWKADSQNSEAKLPQRPSGMEVGPLVEGSPKEPNFHYFLTLHLLVIRNP